MAINFLQPTQFDVAPSLFDSHAHLCALIVFPIHGNRYFLAIVGFDQQSEVKDRTLSRMSIPDPFVDYSAFVLDPVDGDSCLVGYEDKSRHYDDDHAAPRDAAPEGGVAKWSEPFQSAGTLVHGESIAVLLEEIVLGNSQLLAGRFRYSLDDSRYFTAGNEMLRKQRDLVDRARNH